ncbi:transcriptional repressor NrdR [Candidatus Woesearchaeota archaeon]|nr:transcriptional repressor NrdR [Candidatus Woesearchaeota archaeon]
MYCPFCSYADTRVLESRLTENSLRRRRECPECSNRFTTYETAVFHLTVTKKDGREEDFDIQKIYHSIAKACSKTDPATLMQLTKKIEQKILNKKNHPVKTTDIGRIVLSELKKHDKMAYLRYASVYKSIEDPLLLKKELKAIALG